MYLILCANSGGHSLKPSCHLGARGKYWNYPRAGWEPGSVSSPVLSPPTPTFNVLLSLPCKYRCTPASVAVGRLARRSRSKTTWMYSEGAALGKNALWHPSPSLFHSHTLLRHCGNALARSPACRPEPQPSSLPPRALEMEKQRKTHKNKRKEQTRAKAPGSLCSQRERERGGGRSGRAAAPG